MDGRTIATKNILKGVSVYFNPGKMVGIMGPSGCGKTTFLDLLTGRRKTGIIKVWLPSMWSYLKSWEYLTGYFN